MSETTDTFIYDKLPYPSYLHSQTHPDRLATMATFFGMKPAPPDKCRVLELGCANGSTLLSFAYCLPESEFIGIDLSEVQINHGKTSAAEIGLKNLDLRVEDILEVNRERFGTFDYITAHGVYSWTPDFVRERVLQICREMLNPQGVAFVSYNTFPGCHLREILRGMMLYQTRNLSEPAQMLQNSLGLINFIQNSVSPESIYGQILRTEFKEVIERPQENVFHDDLSEVNQPFYFYEFIAETEKNNLQYVGDASHFPNQTKNYAPEVRQTLKAVGDDFLASEQYIDFLENRRFRRSLLCRAEVELNRQPDSEILKNFKYSSPVKPVSEKPEIATPKTEKFASGSDAKVSVNHTLAKAALVFLSTQDNKAVTFDELLQGSKAGIEAETGAPFEIEKDDLEILREIFQSIFGSGLLNIHIFPPRFVTELSEKPCVSKLARWQIQHSVKVSTLRSQSVDIEGFLAKHLLIATAGTRTIDQLTDELRVLIENNPDEFPNEAARTELLAELKLSVTDNLRQIAALGLLEA